MSELNLNHKLNLSSKQSINSFKITFISNITLQPYMHKLLCRSYTEMGIIPEIDFIKYEEYIENEILLKSNLLVVWLNFDELFNNIHIFNNKEILSYIYNICNIIYKKIRIDYKSLVIWFGFEDFYDKSNIVSGNISISNKLVDKLNNLLYESFDSQTLLIDMKRIIAEEGINYAYNNTTKYRWSMPYSIELLEKCSKEIYKQYCIYKGITKKCIVLDCDNVLWGGILLEDGIQNIKLGSIGKGKMYKEFQKYLLDLYYKGVILTICSKNDLVDVENMFTQHSEMILKKEHIACFKVNWENKANNIKAISQYLNIDLNSMVFIDDSIFEIKLINQFLPEVKGVLFENYTVYEQLSGFNLKNELNSNIISTRNMTYITNQLREELKEKYINYDDYLMALEIKILIKEADKSEHNRISELSQRTNKVTNGKRYTVSELEEKISKNNFKLYAVYVSDKYSDLGLVGAMSVNNGILELFCLSCRALGRNIEQKMLENIQNKAIQTYDYIDTGKNNLVKELFQKIN
ncbi:MAG: HAD-IIIC family phosphatase [Clostridium sp.]